jgi:sRNA-binding protein
MKRGPITNPVLLDDVLHFYKDHLGYRYHVKAGQGRVDLDGNMTEKVTEAEQQEAEQQIREIRKSLREKRQANANDFEVEMKKPRPRVAIPAVVLPDDEQMAFSRIESFALKARSLRMEDVDLGKDLAVKILELVRLEVDKLIGKYSSANS